MTHLLVIIFSKDGFVIMSLVYLAIPSVVGNWLHNCYGYWLGMVSQCWDIQIHGKQVSHN